MAISLMRGHHRKFLKTQINRTRQIIGELKVFGIKLYLVWEGTKGGKIADFSGRTRKVAKPLNLALKVIIYTS